MQILKIPKASYLVPTPTWSLLSFFLFFYSIIQQKTFRGADVIENTHAKKAFTHSHQHRKNQIKKQRCQQSVPSGLLLGDVIVVSLQTLDLLLYLIKTMWQTTSVRLSSLLYWLTSHFCPLDLGVQQFINNSPCFRTPIDHKKSSSGRILAEELEPQEWA